MTCCINEQEHVDLYMDLRLLNTLLAERANDRKPNARRGHHIYGVQSGHVSEMARKRPTRHEDTLSLLVIPYQDREEAGELGKITRSFDEITAEMSLEARFRHNETQIHKVTYTVPRKSQAGKRGIFLFFMFMRGACP